MEQKHELDSPFLSEEVFGEEPEERWEPRASALASESPFQTAFDPVPAGAPEAANALPVGGPADSYTDEVVDEREAEDLTEGLQEFSEDFEPEASVPLGESESDEDEELTNAWRGDDESDESDESDGFVEMEAPPRPPPRAKPRTESVTLAAPPQGVLVDITIEVLPDKIDPSIEDAAGRTRCSWKEGSLQFRSPQVTVERWRDRHPPESIVRGITTPPSVSATLSIQTSYKRRGIEKGYSGYGRGTTRQDKRARNTSIGFHEWCHRMACIRYLQTKSLPDFTGSIGMKEADFWKAWTTFMHEFRNLPFKIHEYSGQQVDEVGNPTKSEYDRRKSRRRRETPDETEEFTELEFAAAPEFENLEREEPESLDEDTAEEEEESGPDGLPDDVDEQEFSEEANPEDVEALVSVEREAARKTQPEIVLVAGANYPKFEKSGSIWKRVRQLSPGPWREYCLKLANFRLKQNPKLKVTLFDFFLGTRENVTLGASNRVTTTVEQQFTRPIPDDYWNLVGIDEKQPASYLTARLEPANKTSIRNKEKIGYFDGAHTLGKGGSLALIKYVNEVRVAAPVISMTDVYSYIAGFPRSGKKGSLMELHFFSHAFNIMTGHYSGGPILLNSMDDPLHPDSRWKLDKDARAAKDFRKPAMDPAVFAQAFGTGARSFVWGCNFQRGFIRQFVHQISKNRKALAAGGPMKISYNADWIDVNEFRAKLGLAAGASVRNVSVSLAKIKQILTETNQATYMQKLATASGHPVVGAPPGTYASPDGSRSPLELHHIPMSKSPFRNAKETDNFEPALLVFRDHLDSNFDKSLGDHDGLGRGYIVFNP